MSVGPLALRGSKYTSDFFETNPTHKKNYALRPCQGLIFEFRACWLKPVYYA